MSHDLLVQMAYIVLRSTAPMRQGPVARSLVSANRWLRGIKMYRFPWYLTLVSTNHASSNPGQNCRRKITGQRCFKNGCVRHVIDTARGEKSPL